MDTKSLTIEQLAEFAASIESMLAVIFADHECSILVGVGPRADQLIIEMVREGHTFKAGVSLEYLVDDDCDLGALQSAAAFQLHQEWNRRLMQ